MAQKKQDSKKVQSKEVKNIKHEEEIVEETSENISQSKTEEINDLKMQIEQMKDLINSLTEKNSNSTDKVIIKEEEEEIEIGTYMVQGVGLTAGDIEVKISTEMPQGLPLSDVKKLLRKQEIRRLFEDGVCYFINEEDYALLKVKRKVDLSQKNIKSILLKDNIQDIIKDLKYMTSDLKDATITHCLIYNICDLIRKGEIPELNYYVRKDIESFFKIDGGFERGIKTLNDLESLRK